MILFSDSETHPSGLPPTVSFSEQQSQVVVDFGTSFLAQFIIQCCLQSLPTPEMVEMLMMPPTILCSFYVLCRACCCQIPEVT